MIKNNMSIESKILNIKLSDFLSNFLSFDKNKKQNFSLCPFHKEKTASFFINDKKQLYYCFGCKRGGNIINFIMEYKKLNFNEAIIFIINFYNLNKINNSNYVEFDLLKKITILYKKNLIININKNEELNLLLKKRFLNQDIINIFDIGFASNDWDFILKRFKKEVKILLRIGLIKENKNYLYDKFKNRLIIPIKDKNSNIVGFGARTLKENIKPKYINSDQSELFDKSSILFNLDLALQSSLQEIYIVEGYFDVISAYSIGITNVVSSMGTSFSFKQFNILKNIYKKIIFCYDGDHAGQEAQFRIAKSLMCYLDQDVYIGFIILPENEDPDSMINSKNKDIFFSLIKKPLFILDYIFFYLTKNIINLTEKNLNFQNILEELTNHIKNINLKNKILNYLKNLFFSNIKNKKKIIKKKILSLPIKASIILIEKKDLINLIDYNKLIKLYCSQKNDIKILLKVINTIKNNILKNKNFLENLAYENKSYSLLVQEMSNSVALDELLSIIKNISIN